MPGPSFYPLEDERPFTAEEWAAMAAASRLRREVNPKEEKMYRHGDVLFEKADAIPADAKRVVPGPRGYVLAEGEATGHAHVIEATPDVEMYERDGVMYLRVLDPVEVEHEEHNRTKAGAPPMLPPGDYRVQPEQRVWDSGAIRKVVD